MNWVGGSRKRARGSLNGERKIQKEYFERKRLSSNVHIQKDKTNNLQEKKNNVSQDILLLQRQFKNGAQSKPKVRVVNMGSKKTCSVFEQLNGKHFKGLRRHQIESVELPLSPTESPSNLSLLHSKPRPQFTTEDSIFAVPNSCAVRTSRRLNPVQGGSYRRSTCHPGVSSSIELFGAPMEITSEHDKDATLSNGRPDSCQVEDSTSNKMPTYHQRKATLEYGKQNVNICRDKERDFNLRDLFVSEDYQRVPLSAFSNSIHNISAAEDYVASSPFVPQHSSFTSSQDASRKNRNMNFHRNYGSVSPCSSVFDDSNIMPVQTSSLSCLPVSVSNNCTSLHGFNINSPERALSFMAPISQNINALQSQDCDESIPSSIWDHHNNFTARNTLQKLDALNDSIFNTSPKRKADNTQETAIPLIDYDADKYSWLPCLPLTSLETGNILRGQERSKSSYIPSPGDSESFRHNHFKVSSGLDASPETSIINQSDKGCLYTASLLENDGSYHHDHSKVSRCLIGLDDTYPCAKSDEPNQACAVPSQLSSRACEGFESANCTAADYRDKANNPVADVVQEVCLLEEQCSDGKLDSQASKSSLTRITSESSLIANEHNDETTQPEINQISQVLHHEDNRISTYSQTSPNRVCDAACSPIVFPHSPNSNDNNNTNEDLATDRTYSLRSRVNKK